MFHLRHLGDEIGRLDHLVHGIAAGHDNMLHRRPGAQRGDNFGKIEIIVAQHDIEFIEQHDVVDIVVNQRFRLFPRGLCCGDIALPATKLGPA